MRAARSRRYRAGEPRTFVYVSDETGSLAGCKKKEKEAHDLHGTDSQSTEIIDIGRASDA